MVYVDFETKIFEYETLDIMKLFFKEGQIHVLKDKASDVYAEAEFFFKTWVEDKEDSQLFNLSLEEKNHSFLIKVALINSESIKERKVSFKTELYKVLSNVTGKKPPWGILTGIRPSKIVHGMLEKGKNEEEVLKELQEHYLVSLKKASLLYDIAAVERNILDTAHDNNIGIYIGIPFCPTRCLYCSFTSSPINKYRHLVNDYIDALEMETKGVIEIIENNLLKVQSIYIGGGTPTSIEPDQLARLMDIVNSNFNMEKVKEYTIEAGRPDTIDRDKLQIIKNSNVTRISINPQTMNNETLDVIGRDHKAEDIKKAFALAREIGFNNINMDIITGLPGENLQMFENTLKEIKKLSPESLTVHTLAVKRASRFREEKEKYKLISEEEASNMVDLAYYYATNMGMHPYYLYRQKNILGNLENVGYCRPGFESIYNIQIMGERQTIIALGAGGVTKVVYPHDDRIERAFNVKNVEEYIKRIPEMLGRKKELLIR
jgi:coproporphyrinogen dehydrogenase HemZ